ncbi:hypothetical protein B0H66DRAFT_552076 [Apodospora peruviana]|uniref:Kinetochore protein mis14 n=1 Tax=Apodospora peruviana TaxID=516989 RepID=A0AAE0IBC3_9PEZI|nr:hypothetical protein B0H66DRAFT_552076 [Apodospora peruviana]
MDPSQRRIELQGPEDLTYLINNVRRAAADSINAAFPPVPDGGDDYQEDELRLRIEQMVNDYIIQTFTLAAPNLSINGMPVDLDRFLAPAPESNPNPNPNPKSKSKKSKSKSSAAPTTKTTTGLVWRGSPHPTPEEQYEPFDARKRARVEDLAREEEDLLRAIATLKRRVPAATANTWAAASRASLAADEQALEAARARVIADIQSSTPTTTSGREGTTQTTEKLFLLDGIGLPLERQAGVEKGFSGAVEALGRLKRDMPATVAKMERARVAGQYVVTER